MILEKGISNFLMNLFIHEMEKKKKKGLYFHETENGKF